MAAAPPWLETARKYLGVEEVNGAGNNPTILGFIRTIANAFPDQAAYAANYRSDDTAWCGVFAANCLAETGRRGPFVKGADLKSWMWANAWQSYGTRTTPKIGAIACFDRHVGFVDEVVDADTVVVIGGNQSSPGGGAVTRSRRQIGSAKAFRWPEDPVAEQKSASDGTLFADITATVFGGAGDEQPTAYSDVKPGWADRPGVALPDRFPPGARPKVRVFSQDNRDSVVCEIVDVGPWNTDDPYWQTGRRPQAESGTDMRGRRTNKAGIDLTPAAAAAIGLPGKGLVTWEFVTDQPEAPVAEPKPDPKPSLPATTRPSKLGDGKLDMAFLMQLMQMIVDLVSTLREMKSQPAPEPIVIQPAPPPPPPPPAPSVIEKPSVQASVAAGAPIWIAQAGGGLPAPGSGWLGLLLTALPMVSAAFGATGGFSSIGSLIGGAARLFSGSGQQQK